MSPETGDVFRAVAAYLGCTLDELAQRMLADYIPRHVPQLEIVFDDDDIAQRDLAAVRGAVSIFGTPAVAAEISARPKRGKRR